jgi:hypothetical protein
VYQRIVEAVNQPQGTVQQIADIISVDIATSTEVLCLVNSALYSLPRQIVSVEEAVSLLGLESVTSLVLAGSMVRSASLPGGRGATRARAARPPRAGRAGTRVVRVHGCRPLRRTCSGGGTFPRSWVAGQPLSREEPGATGFEQILGYAFRRVIGGPSVLPPAPLLDPHRGWWTSPGYSKRSGMGAREPGAVEHLGRERAGLGRGIGCYRSLIRSPGTVAGGSGCRVRYPARASRSSPPVVRSVPSANVVKLLSPAAKNSFVVTR